MDLCELGVVVDTLDLLRLWLQNNLDERYTSSVRQFSANGNQVKMFTRLVQQVSADTTNGLKRLCNLSALLYNAHTVMLGSDFRADDHS